MNFLILTLISLGELILEICYWVVMLYFVLSWLILFGVVNTRNPLVRQLIDMLARLVTPFLVRIRRFVPPFNGVDISSLVLLMLVWFLGRLLKNLQMLSF